MKTVTLQIKKKELELIKSGVKIEDWRSPSVYNKNLLLKFNAQGKREANPEITHIQFVNGYGPDVPKLLVKVSKIRPVKFQDDVERPEMNLYAKKDSCVIVIYLGAIVK